MHPSKSRVVRISASNSNQHFPSIPVLPTRSNPPVPTHQCFTPSGTRRRKGRRREGEEEGRGGERRGGGGRGGGKGRRRGGEEEGERKEGEEEEGGPAVRQALLRCVSVGALQTPRIVLTRLRFSRKRVCVCVCVGGGGGGAGPRPRTN
jgi:hypothetical protein